MSSRQRGESSCVLFSDLFSDLHPLPFGVEGIVCWGCLTWLGSRNLFECLGFFLQIPRVTVSGFRKEGIQQGVTDACSGGEQFASVPTLPRDAVVHDKGIPAIGPKLKLPRNREARLPIAPREGTGLALVEGRAKVNLAEVGREVKVHGHDLLERVGVRWHFVPFDITVKGWAWMSREIGHPGFLDSVAVDQIRCELPIQAALQLRIGEGGNHPTPQIATANGKPSHPDSCEIIKSANTVTRVRIVWPRPIVIGRWKVGQQCGIHVRGKKL